METQLIKGNTHLVGLLGNPVAHSISPIIHNHIFKTLRIPYVYVPLCVSEKDIAGAVRALKLFNFSGANVTIPYKNAILPLCDKVSDISQETGTINTLYFKDGLLHGTTTDGQGFLKALSTMGCSTAHKNVVIIGNGGTARTLCFSLIQKNNIASMALIGRSTIGVKNLCSQIQKKTGFPLEYTTFNTKECKQIIKECTLLVNCTPLGMFPNVGESPLPKHLFHKGMTVFDTIYNPVETLFLHNAKKAGCPIQNGLLMLIFQALASSQYWTGMPVKSNILNIEEIRSFL